MIGIQSMFQTQPEHDQNQPQPVLKPSIELSMECFLSRQGKPGAIKDWGGAILEPTNVSRQLKRTTFRIAEHA